MRFIAEELREYMAKLVSVHWMNGRTHGPAEVKENARIQRLLKLI